MSALHNKCETCHQIDGDGKIDPAAVTVSETADRDKAMEAFHARCLTCHRKRGKAKHKTGPYLGCVGCHVKATTGSSRQKMSFDYSLHARHEKATEGKCEPCHGHEGDKKPGAAMMVRQSAHVSCVSCHLERAKGTATGPVSCSGCHASAAQRAYMKLAKVPRLVASQKDFKLIHSDSAKMPAVPFDHKAHEPRTRFCADCHHAIDSKIAACSSCHTVSAPADKGGGVRLEQALHRVTSKRSCVGCHHQETTANKDCAGCHHAFEQPPSETGCRKCHAGRSPTSAPTTAPTTAPTSQPTSRPIVVASEGLPPVGDGFPEAPVIRVLANKYEPSVLPHKKIVERLAAIADKSPLAKVMHGSTATLCAGCHHHSPVGQRPPACRSCHGSKAHATRDQPHLLAAYHRQCIGCHQKMKIKAVGCTDCHADKGGAK